jgi:hypothetical protein
MLRTFPTTILKVSILTLAIMLIGAGDWNLGQRSGYGS